MRFSQAAPTAFKVLLGLVFLTPLTNTFGQSDIEGSKDHPMVSRMPGYFIASYQDQEFGAHEFPVKPEELRRVEGHFWKIDYQIREGAKLAGPLQIARNYTNAFVQRGGVKLTEIVDSNGGQSVARLPVAGKNIWMELDIANGGEIYTLIIVEEAGMEQKVQFTGAQLAQILNERGSVALHNILFDTAKATLKVESQPGLAIIGDLLKSDASLKLEIQGHTDNVGSKENNLKLSRERAESVKTYLVSKFGIEASRLAAAGYGDSKPLADNSTEEGRAQNRRVELVKR